MLMIEMMVPNPCCLLLFIFIYVLIFADIFFGLFNFNVVLLPVGLISSWCSFVFIGSSFYVCTNCVSYFCVGCCNFCIGCCCCGLKLHCSEHNFCFSKTAVTCDFYFIHFFAYRQIAQSTESVGCPPLQFAQTVLRQCDAS